MAMPLPLKEFLESLAPGEAAGVWVYLGEAAGVWVYLDEEPDAIQEMIETVVDSHPGLGDAPTPVTGPDGNVLDFTLTVSGKPFYCACGANVFHKPDAKDPNRFQCNSCGQEYLSEV